MAHADPDVRREYYRRWSENNRDKIRGYAEKSQARKSPSQIADEKKVKNDRSSLWLIETYTSRHKWLDELKIRRGCIDCGYNAHACALHFDHRDPSEKLFGIGMGITRRMDKLLAEIDKCDVRCANCHSVRSKEFKHVGQPSKRKLAS